MMNQTRWLDLMNRLGLPPSVKTFDELMATHSGATRHYHNVEHVSRCLELIDRFRTEIPNADLVELAFWFHDAIYDATSKTNEEDSADWAKRFLIESGASEEKRSLVIELILATKHATSDLAQSAQWMVDIDLSILGAERAIFEQYEKDIRLEYAWVPDEEFNQRRAALLLGFLERQRLFHTQECRALFKEQARENLRDSLARLR